MGCNCEKQVNERFKDIEHVTILATQCANIQKIDYIVFWQGARYDFEPLTDNPREFLRLIRYNRYVTNTDIPGVTEEPKPSVISKKTRVKREV